MFEQMVFVERQRAHWLRLSSLLLQAMVISAAILYSTLHVDPPPPLRIETTPPVFLREQVVKLIPRAKELLARGQSAMLPEPAATTVLVVPRAIPHGVTQESGPEPTVANYACTDCRGTGARDALRSVIGGGSDAVRVRPAAPERPVKISQFSEGMLTHKVQPVYPEAAKIAGVQGAVVLHAVISGSGTIESLRVVSGPPLLRTAALQAVQQWRYRTYMLNGHAVEVETEITVNFTLAR